MTLLTKPLSSGCFRHRAEAWGCSDHLSRTTRSCAGWVGAIRPKSDGRSDLRPMLRCPLVPMVQLPNSIPSIDAIDRFVFTRMQHRLCGGFVCPVCGTYVRVHEISAFCQALNGDVLNAELAPAGAISGDEPGTAMIQPASPLSVEGVSNGRL